MNSLRWSRQCIRRFLRKHDSKRRCSNATPSQRILLQGLKKPPILRALLFTLGIGVGSFYLADELRKQKSVPRLWNPQKRFKKDPETLPEMWAAIPEHSRTLSLLVGLNALVLLGWRLLPQNIMSSNSVHSPFSGRVYTMLTSTISHQSGVHFLVNMIAMWSFGGPIHQYLGREQFLAFYVTSGVTAGLTSHLWFSLTKQFSGSLGASGAVLGLVGMFSYLVPEATLLLFFVLPLQAKILTPAIAVFDTIGLSGIWTRIFGFRLDHAAHLGGLACGVALASTILHPQKRAYWQERRRAFTQRIKDYVSVTNKSKPES